MALISICGPHAIGKTTAMRRWHERYPRLQAVSADLSVLFHPDGDRSVPEWKGNVEEKEKAVRDCLASSLVYAVESVRTTQLNYIPQDSQVILVVCSGDMLGQFLRSRCERAGKRFNEPYWDAGKLEYESHWRYENFARKKLNPKQYRLFKIQDKVRDWQLVDEYFGQIYRRIHNQLVRSQS